MGQGEREEVRAVLSRRTALALGVAGGAELLVGQANAAEPERAPGPGQVGEFASFVVTFYWSNLLNDDTKQAIKDMVSQATLDVGRKLFGFFENLINAPGGRRAPITIRIHKHPAGHLVVGAQLEDMDGDGKPEMTHAGTAPHARHPDMHAHAKQIVGKAHAWLRAHRM